MNCVRCGHPKDEHIDGGGLCAWSPDAGTECDCSEFVAPKRRLVIYHGGCPDGFAAAWAAWHAFGDDDTEYFAAMYDRRPPDVVGRDVFILDFSYSREVTIRLTEDAASLIVIDHHKSARDDLAGLPNTIFDMDRSGAGLAWDHLVRVPRSWVIDYVEDRDLWRFKLPDSKTINAWLCAQPRESFRHWLEMAAEGPEAAHERGIGIVTYLDQYVHAGAETAVLVEFDGHAGIPRVNAQYTGISELVGHLAEGRPFAIGWFQDSDGLYSYSLRSRGDVDVSEIARRYGGGGHRGSAGFKASVLHGVIQGPLSKGGPRG